MTTIRQLPPIGCTGSCNQGRACTCQPDVDYSDNDGPPRVPLTPLDAVLLVAVYAASFACVVALAVWTLTPPN